MNSSRTDFYLLFYASAPVSLTTAWYFCNLFNSKSPSLTNDWYCAFLLSGLFVSTIPEISYLYDWHTINSINHAIELLWRNESAEVPNISIRLEGSHTHQWTPLSHRIAQPCNQCSNFDNSPVVGHMLSVSSRGHILSRETPGICPFWGVALPRRGQESIARIHECRESWWGDPMVPEWDDWEEFEGLQENRWPIMNTRRWRMLPWSWDQRGKERSILRA